MVRVAGVEKRIIQKSKKCVCVLPSDLKGTLYNSASSEAAGQLSTTTVE